MTKSESITYVQSFTLVKNLFRASFSSIAFIRGLFEDEVRIHFLHHCFISVSWSFSDIFSPHFVPKFFEAGRIAGAKIKKLKDADDEEVKNFLAVRHQLFSSASFPHSFNLDLLLIFRFVF